MDLKSIIPNIVPLKTCIQNTCFYQSCGREMAKLRRLYPQIHYRTRARSSTEGLRVALRSLIFSFLYSFFPPTSKGRPMISHFFRIPPHLPWREIWVQGVLRWRTPLPRLTIAQNVRESCSHSQEKREQ